MLANSNFKATEQEEAESGHFSHSKSLEYKQ